MEHLIYLPAPEERGHTLFAVRVSGTCLEPRVIDGHTAVIDRDATAKAGDVVLAIHDGEAVLKILEIIDGQPYLVTLHGHPPIAVGENTRIVGKALTALYKI